MQLQLSALLSLLTVALFAVPALSQDTINIMAYKSNMRCMGPKFTFCNVAPGICCNNIPRGYGYSAFFQGLMPGSVGDGFVMSSCASQQLFEVHPGRECWNSMSSHPVGSMNWHPAGGCAERCLLEDGRTKGPAPSLFTYDDHVGVENTIAVPVDDEDAAQKIADLYEAKDFEALAKYEKGE
jgi:hypothetical protein